MAAKEFFTYCPESGFETYATAEEALSASKELIAAYLDDTWGDEVTQVVTGRISYRATQTNLVEIVGELDEDGYDEAGEYWGGDSDSKCDYEMLPVSPQETSVPDAVQQTTQIELADA